MAKSLGPKWLKKAVFYQIYPTSFCDSNGDGIGDLQGIISKLDYLAALGINAVWLSPCFKSPFCDGGYDVSDFRQVDERFGTNEDLIELFSEAAKRDIKVCLDLVAGHTSTEHEWFKKSSLPEKNEYSDYYIWNDSWVGGSGGMSMISGTTSRDGRFAINFFAMQPALNYGFAKPDPAYPWQLPVDHPTVLKVREELKNIMRFWLDKGAAGFRVDMAPSLVKNDPGRKKTMELWREVRKMMDKEYPEAVLISEWSYAPQALKAGFHCDFMLHCMTPAYTSLFRNEPKRDIFQSVDRALFYENDGNDYNLKNRNSYFDASGKGDGNAFFKIWLDHYQRIKNDGFISLPTGNHDLPRISDFRNENDLTVVCTFLITMPGVPFIYYGDEIGMRNQPNLVSKDGGYTRTQARTPMQWSDSANAGFSTAAAEKLYLPVDTAPDRPNAAEQMQREDSLWNRVQELLKIKRSVSAFDADANFELLSVSYPTIYLRSKGKEKYLVLIQPADHKWRKKIRLPFKAEKLMPCFGNVNEVESSGTSVTFSGDGTSWGIWKIK